MSAVYNFFFYLEHCHVCFFACGTATQVPGSAQLFQYAAWFVRAGAVLALWGGQGVCTILAG